MATKVYEEFEVELQGGQIVTVKPLNIKRLRKFMEVVKGLEDLDEDQEIESLSILVRAAGIAIGQFNPELGANEELLEESLDIPTIHRILEVAGGVKMNADPNLLAGME